MKWWNLLENVMGQIFQTAKPGKRYDACHDVYICWSHCTYLSTNNELILKLVMCHYTQRYTIIYFVCLSGYRNTTECFYLLLQCLSSKWFWKFLAWVSNNTLGQDGTSMTSQWHSCLCVEWLFFPWFLHLCMWWYFDRFGCSDCSSWRNVTETCSGL